MLNIFNIIAIILSIACAVIAKVFLDANKEEKFKKALWLKGAAGLCFVLVGLLMAVRNPGSTAWIVMCGLVLGLIGDELIALRFLDKKKETLYFSLGAAAFAVGHIFYIWALLSTCGSILLKTLILGAVGLVMSALYNKKKHSDAGELKGAAIGYVILVVVMGSIACACAWDAFSVKTLLFAIGGVCFILSDNILIAYNFGKDKRFLLNILIHITYYAAQLAIAWSIGF